MMSRRFSNRLSAVLVMLAAAMLASCETQTQEGWLGYAEGEEAFIISPQPGWLTSVEVQRGANVAIGDMLFTLDATRELAARDNAQAAIAAANAMITQAEAQAAQAVATRAQAEADTLRSEREYERQEGLVAIGATPQSAVESAEASLQNARARRSQAEAQRAQAMGLRAQAEAQIAEAEAALATAEYNLSERSIQSRVAGTVQDLYFRAGEYATTAPVLSILPPENVFIRFFIPETDLANLRLGDPVRIGCDGCPENLTANISFISSEVEFTPPIIYSVNNRQKLVFKAEARLPGGLPLRPGLPVNVTLVP
jgi:HlyD family secretion protein